MSTKMDATIEAVEKADCWVGGAVVVAEDNGEYNAIPGAYLTDCSYTGSRDVVIDLSYGLSGSTGYGDCDLSDPEQVRQVAELLING